MSQAVEDRDIDQTPTTTAPTKPTQLDLPWSKQDHAVFSHASATAPAAHAEQRRRRPSSAPAPRGSGARAVWTYPTVFVSAPRAVAARYWHQPWTDVLAAAERGVDGLAVVTERPRHWGGRQGEPPPRVPDVAFLADGQDDWRGRTVLHQQNWSEYGCL